MLVRNLMQMSSFAAFFSFSMSMWAIAGSCGQTADSDMCSSHAQISMLQLGSVLTQQPQNQCGYLLIDACDPRANYRCSNNCRIHSHGADCFRSVVDVMNEHPGTDGYCWFNATAFWVIYAGPVPHFEEEAVSGVLGLREPDYKGLNQGPLLTYYFEGQVITSYMDSAHYSFDDLYGYALGFLQGQGLDPTWMKDPSRWISLSQQACDRIQQSYNFSNEELVLADWLDFNQILASMAFCSAGVIYNITDQSLLTNSPGSSSCRNITRRDMAKHHYVKCVLGHRNSAGDMAYLNSRACLLEGNRIGHFSECPYSPPGVDF
ncbi:unnamed protein product [Symbiodinium sp. CCMP2592]|nr:unnamed protein product [Symbiodinium sp. CCMP2592]